MIKTTPIIKLISLIVMVSSINGQSLRYPPNPCPQIFSYQNDNRDNYGQIMIPYDNSQMFVLDVNASMVGYYNNLKLKLTLLTPVNDIRAGTVLKFRVDFPLRNVLPRITEVAYNKNVYCSGAPEPIGREGVTSLWATLRYQLTTVSTNVINPDLNHIFQLPTLPTQPTWTLPTVPTQPTWTLPTVPTIPDDDYPVWPAAKPPQQPKPDFTTKQPPKEIVDRLPPTFEQNCGIANNIQTLAINGLPTGENEFPWLVAIYVRDNQVNNFKCTANLISDKHAITAAHCLQYFNAPLVPQENIFLILGTTNITKWSVIRTVERITVHPDYQQNTGHGDVAIITFKQRVEISRTIRPICLWDDNTILNQIINQDGILAGWVRDQNSNVDITRKVTISVVEQTRCSSDQTSNMTFCASGTESNDPNKDDSGAGFMIRKEGKWMLRGVVSFALSTPNLQNFVLFADVAKYGHWIKETLNKEHF